MKNFSAALLSVLLLLTGIQNAFAIEVVTASQKTEESALEKKLDAYNKRWIEKFDYGVPNFLMGWTTVISEPRAHTPSGNSRWKNTLSYLPSIGKGLVLFPVDTIGGFLNMLTAPVPAKIPLPQGGINPAEVTFNKTEPWKNPNLDPQQKDPEFYLPAAV